MDDPFYLFMHIPRLQERRLEVLWMNNMASKCVDLLQPNSTQLLDNLEMTLQARLRLPGADYGRLSMASIYPSPGPVNM